MEFLKLLSVLYTKRRRVITILLTVLTSVTTITVVHKCALEDTVRMQTTIPVQKVAQAVHGTVIASAELRLPRRDTVIVHDTIVTTRVVTRWEPEHVPQAATGQAASTRPGNAVVYPPAIRMTRTASFRDSTFAGIIVGIVTAPPDSGALGIRYQLTRPVFAPTVAFLQTRGRPLVTVSWQGEHVTLDHVVFRPDGSPWIRYVEATYEPTARKVMLDGAVGVRLGGVADIEMRAAQQVTPRISPEMMLVVRRNL